MNRGSLHTRSFKRMHFFVFRYRSTKNGFTGLESFRGFRETGPRGGFCFHRVVFGVVFVVVSTAFCFLCGERLSAIETDLFVRFRCVWAFVCFALVCRHSSIFFCLRMRRGLHVCLLFNLLLKFRNMFKTYSETRSFFGLD